LGSPRAFRLDASFSQRSQDPAAPSLDRKSTLRRQHIGAGKRNNSRETLLNNIELEKINEKALIALEPSREGDEFS
jgi:hypothetical protein